MYSATALLFLSMVTAGTPAASVGGSVKVIEGGAELNCIGVLLIPRSPEIDAAIQQKFGTADEGVQATITPSIPEVKYDPPRGSRRSRCRGRFLERFEFSQVPPGEYFLTMTAVPGRRYDDDKFRRKKIEMMRRISVAPTSPVKVDFKYID